MPIYKDKERDTWFCKFNYKDWRDETKTKLKRGFRTKKEAQEWEREFLQVQQADMDMEFSKFVDVYFTDKAPRLKERTIETKRIMLDTRIIPYFGKLRMNAIKPADIMKWQNDMMDQDYKPTYLRMLQNQVTAVFNHAERFYGLKDNPCKKIDKMGKANARELNFWTKEEYDRFIQNFDEKEEMYRLMYQMLFWLGCRVGELLAICYGDINFKEKTVSITKTYYRRNKTDYITAPKTESSNRIVTMPDFLVEELKAYTDKMYELKAEERIFMVTDRAVQKKMKQKADKLNLKHIRVHDLRHSHIAFLIEKGTQPLIISKRVGHDSVTTTMNIYGHLYPDKQRQLADMLNEEATGEMQNSVVDMGAEVRFRKTGGW
ncbi:MAG: site-specific integrase [Lachnospiraceae bacterium]|nr:site-specific integrase [Lachnospiraceae bacterium]